jgi:hypothetical protein
MSDKSLFDVLGAIGELFFVWSTDSEISNLNKEVKKLKKRARSSKKTDPLRAEIDSLRLANSELRLYGPPSVAFSSSRVSSAGTTWPGC